MATTTSRSYKPVRATPSSIAPNGKNRPAPPKPKPKQETPVEIAREEVDGKTAALWLERNASNRQIRKNRVAEFRRDMINDQWKDIGGTILFDTHGSMIDGQHRLMALVQASEIRPELTVPFVVTRGVHPEDRHVIDTGTRRTASDQLGILGYQNSKILAAGAKWCLVWDRKSLYLADKSQSTISHSEIIDYVEKHDAELTFCADEARAGAKRLHGLPAGYIAATYVLFRRVDKKAADDFFGRLTIGDELVQGDPIWALRNRIADLHHTRTHLPGDQYLSLLVRTWNARREGRTMRTVPLYKSNVPIACPDNIR
jgi:hypothetical protein